MPEGTFDELVDPFKAATDPTHPDSAGAGVPTAPESSAKKVDPLDTDHDERGLYERDLDGDGRSDADQTGGA